jgi:multicomponent Na+:H+ antiporter subunit D
MSAGSLMPLAVVIPLGGAAISPLVARLHRRLPLIVGTLSMTGSAAVLVLVARSVYAGNGAFVVHYFSNEHPIGGKALGIAFAADPFGTAFAGLTAALGLLLFVSLQSELGDLGPRELGGLAALTQLLLAALIAAALTADSINLFVWFEVAALASYGLTGFFLERPIAVEAAFKNLVLTSIAGFAVFVAAGMLYSAYGALNFGQLHDALRGRVHAPALIALALFVAGFGTKAGVMPFHAWLPDAHVPVPGAVSALFSGLMVNLGVVALVRIGLLVYGPGDRHAVLGLLTGIGIVSAVLGAVLALAQNDLKRLLAWDTVSQMGVLLIGFASATTYGVAGAAYHLINHGLFKALLFLCAGAIVHATGTTKLSDMGGLARSRPLTTAAFTLGVLAIAGVPPMNGYASLGLIHEGVRHEPVVYTLALLAQVITVAALSRAAYLGFYRRRSEPYEHLEPTRLGMRIALGTLAACSVAFGVLAPTLTKRLARPAASTLLHPDAYANAVLSGHGSVSALSVQFSYAKIGDLLFAALEVALGLVLAAVYVRRPREPRPVTWLRRLHTGSVNDYAAFTAAGLVLSAVVLAR